MESLFVRSLALPAAQQAQCVANASRTTADGTFAVASAAEGVIRVYAASCGALLHEFASIHKRIYALHYTSFSDSLVTLESDVLPRANDESDNSDDGDDDDDNVETFLCVYHDWRERKMVRGYTLPLGVLESPVSRRKADCVAVCSFTGRVVVAMGSVLNLWQCSRGFFEHVLELKVDMAQAHAFLQVEFVAIHGVYVAFASQTEVRVMEIHVHSSSKETEPSSPSAALRFPAPSALHAAPPQPDAPHVPADEVDCVSIATVDDLRAFVDVPIPCPSYCDADAPDPRDEQRLFDELDEPAQPLVLGRNEAQQEAWNLAGLVKSQDVRVNRALAYAVGERDVHVLLQRFLPPHHSVRSLAFLPETIDNQVSVEARSYTRLLVATECTAFLYYFLSREADATRKQMARKVFGASDDHARRQLHRTKSRGTHRPIHVRTADDDSDSDDLDTLTNDSASDKDEDEDATTASGRVVMFYQFSSPVSCIAANSSFLFVATLAGLQVWSIWSPCHYVAASRALSKSLVPQPTQPQLLCTQPMPYPAAQIAALDSYVVLLPARHATQPFDFIRLGSMAAADRLPDGEFELRRARSTGSRSTSRTAPRSVLVFQQSPPSLIFAYMRNAILATERFDSAIHASQIDLLLSLFSLYRYRADVGLDQLHVQRTAAAAASPSDPTDAKETLALELETKLYDAIAKACAADLAAIFTSETHRNLSRAARLYVASNVASSEVLQRFQAIASAENRAEVIDATSKYLEAFVFPSTEALPTTAAMASARRGTSTERHFTRTVLLHYGTYAPEQLSRLIIDAALVWSLEDIAFGLAKLTESTSQSALVRIATLVLVLRASSATSDEWAALATSGADSQQLEGLSAMCADDAMAHRVQELLRDHRDALVHVSVTHPELLVRVVEAPSGARRFTTSAFAHALRACAPRVLLQILERVFARAVRRQEAVLASLLFCLSVVGDAAQASIDRMARAGDAAPGLVFKTDQCLVLRLFVVVLEMFPTLEQLVDKEELHENEDELRRVKAAIGRELVALCVALSSLVQAHGASGADSRPQVLTTLCELFRRSDSARQDERDNSVGAALPAWVHEYLDARCLPTVAAAEAPVIELRRRLQFLFALTLELVQERDLVAPAELLRCFEAAAGSKKQRQTPGAWRLENDFAALVVLLTLPRVSRTVDALELIAARTDFANLFLPYAKCYCVTLEEWRCLIQTLSAISESSPEDESPHDEVAIFESVLNHICSTLGPDELLQVLPDDGDLALYMATIEASVRLGEAHASTRSALGLMP